MSVLRPASSPYPHWELLRTLCEHQLWSRPLLALASYLSIPQPLIAVSLVALGSTSSALPIQSTLLHRMRTCPSVPELTPLTNSSVLDNWMFMYRSTETSLPLYSVSPHFNRTTMSLSTLGHVSYEIARERMVEQAERVTYKLWRSGRGLKGATACRRLDVCNGKVALVHLTAIFATQSTGLILGNTVVLEAQQ